MDNVYYPEGDSQLAWVRWTTPDTPQDMVITVRVSGPGNAQGTINCKIVGLDQNPPPNPVADDRNDSFTPSSIPSREQKTSNYAGLNDPTPTHKLELLRQKLELEPESEETLWEVFESAVAQVRIGKGGEISLHQKDQKECAL